jgi:hypothetical protein
MGMLLEGFVDELGPELFFVGAGEGVVAAPFAFPLSVGQSVGDA